MDKLRHSKPLNHGAHWTKTIWNNLRQCVPVFWRPMKKDAKKTLKWRFNPKRKAWAKKDRSKEQQKGKKQKNTVLYSVFLRFTSFTLCLPLRTNLTLYPWYTSCLWNCVGVGCSRSGQSQSQSMLRDFTRLPPTRIFKSLSSTWRCHQTPREQTSLSKNAVCHWVFKRHPTTQKTTQRRIQDSQRRWR